MMHIIVSEFRIVMQKREIQFKFSIYRTLVSTDSSQIFQRKRRADGTYYGVKRFDSRTSAGFDANGVYHYYELDPVTTDDHGSQPYVWQCVVYRTPKSMFASSLAGSTEILIASRRFAIPLVPETIPFFFH